MQEITQQPIGPLYGIQADEVSDVSNHEQLRLVLRYLHNFTPVERLIEFIQCDVITGEAQANNILSTLGKVSLNPKNCRPQSYDGASNVAGHTNGCAAFVKREATFAPYFYCMNHDLNLVLVKACKIPEMHNMLCTVKQTGIFFKYSAKKQHHFETAVQEVNQERKKADLPQIGKSKVKTPCDTRWVERHTALEDFVNQYDAIVTCEAIVQQPVKWDSKSLSEANGLLTKLHQHSFWSHCTQIYISQLISKLSAPCYKEPSRTYKQLTNMSVL